MEEEKKFSPNILFSKLWNKLAEGDKKVKWVLALGLIGMALILMSEFFPGGSNQRESATNTDAYTDTEVENNAYVGQMEQRIKTLVENIEGVGACDVMVTLKQGRQYVYASEDKTTQDKTRDETGQSGQKVQQKEGAERKIVLMDDTGGGSKPLVEARIEPEVNGVAVVCQGGDSARVRERVIETVTTVLGIGSNQVCVTPKTR